jgi:hypothetical protein
MNSVSKDYTLSARPEGSLPFSQEHVNWALSYASRIHSKYILFLFLVVATGLLPSQVLTKCLYIVSPMPAAYHPHINLLNVAILIILGDQLAYNCEAHNISVL